MYFCRRIEIGDCVLQAKKTGDFFQLNPKPLFFYKKNSNQNRQDTAHEGDKILLASQHRRSRRRHMPETI
jgi:hypothetical protein